MIQFSKCNFMTVFSQHFIIAPNFYPEKMSDQTDNKCVGQNKKAEEDTWPI